MNHIYSIVALVMITSCATAPKDEMAVISRAFTAVDADQKIILSKNRSFEITLPSNPETGYDWVLDIDNSNVVSSAYHRYSPDRSGRQGLGGETMWSLRTRSPGEAVLTYSYQHTTNKRLPSSQTVTFMIGVR